MSKIKQSINAKIDKKHLYKTYVTNKLASYFRVKKQTLHDSVDYNDELLKFPILNEQYGFHEVIYSCFLAKDKLNLGVLLNSDKFGKTTLIDEFLEGESHLTKHEANLLMYIHIGGMGLVMYRADMPDVNAAICIHDKTEGGFVIAEVGEFLRALYPTQPVD